MNQKYKKFEPNYAIAPGETIEEVMSDKGLEMSGLSIAVGSEELAKGLLTGLVRIIPEIAVKLESFLDLPASFLLNLEHNYGATLSRLHFAAKETEESQ